MVGTGSKRTRLAGLLLSATALAIAHSQPDSNPYNTSSHLLRNGRTVPYLIRRLPVSSFPQLPAPAQEQMEHRGCLIPQTYQAYGPENVVHGSFEQPGSSDWAVLCSRGGTVSLLVFFGSRTGQQPFVLATSQETERLQTNIATGTLGFNWAIDDGTPHQVHDAQIGLQPRPSLLDHDAVADSTVDRRTIYHFYAKGAWTLLDMPNP
jgi:hypothetical protein